MRISRHQPQVVILCEDITHYHFARKYLRCHGFKRIIPKICPKGRSSGEQYVRTHYAAEVKAHRSKANYLNTALVVVIDADLKSIDERITSLNESPNMIELAQAPRLDTEKIAIFVPARNIETWIHYLNGNDCNEKESYKSLYKKGTSPSQFAEKLAKKICPQGLPDEAPSSLHYACNELNRLQVE
ncbi:hypothetical protein THIOM_004207 [Candidatus Thiomargarita nelsonii]|uniref:Uncharacterized protein n=1 Tax=Candidatus Thiomargarita nelsonii TaxID=1003181 RepID=A0A0A6NYT3_9GAMM|nr:hypothetical protein THIOM_004207 [Candidatus Thiomargarita nelsonii]